IHHRSTRVAKDPDARHGSSQTHDEESSLMTDMRTSSVTREILERETRTWPAPLRTFWIEAHDPLTGDCHWVPQTRYPCARIVTRYLETLPPELKSSKECLLKSRYLQAFLEKAEQNASMRTLYSYVHHLSMAAGILYPEQMSDGRLHGLQKTEARQRRCSE